jgi:hypothetical protein
MKILQFLLYWKYFSFHLEFSKIFPEIFYVSMVITINVAFSLDSRFMNAIFDNIFRFISIILLRQFKAVT